MPRKRHKPEEIVAKLRQVDILVSQGHAVADAVRSIGVTEVTYYRWRQKFGGLKSDQVRRLKDLEAENARLRDLLGKCHEYIVTVNPDCVRGTEDTDEERDDLIDAIDAARAALAGEGKP